MERVTDEWLANTDILAAESADKQFPFDAEYMKWGDACRLAFAQSVAREVLRVIEYRMLRDSPERALQDARARFGLEDEAMVQQARESQQ